MKKSLVVELDWVDCVVVVDVDVGDVDVVVEEGFVGVFVVGMYS